MTEQRLFAAIVDLAHEFHVVAFQQRLELLAEIAVLAPRQFGRDPQRQAHGLGDADCGVGSLFGREAAEKGQVRLRVEYRLQ